MTISAIVAMTENRMIGKNNQLPWHLPADLRHFKTMTMGKSVLMGRKTYESIGRILPGRKFIIMTRNRHFQVPEALVIHSIDAALKAAADMPELVVIGGAELYREAFPFMQRIDMTVVHTVMEGDRYFPEMHSAEWRQIACEDHVADKENVYAYSFLTWERVVLKENLTT